MSVYSNLLAILSISCVTASTMAASSYYEDLLDSRHLEECYSKCPVGSKKVEDEWHSGSCCGEAEECCEAGPGLYVLIFFIIFAFVLGSCACCPCCPMYDSLCCSPNGPCSNTNTAPSHTAGRGLYTTTAPKTSKKTTTIKHKSPKVEHDVEATTSSD